MIHLSASQITMASRCGIQYKNRYLDGRKVPPGIAAARGSGVHGGAQVALEQKIVTATDLPASDVADAAVAEFDNRLNNEGVAFTKEEETRGTNIVIGETRDVVASLAHYWGASVQHEYNPVLVEHRFEFPLESLGVNFLGYIDLVDASGAVVDWKTGTRKIPAAEARTSVQLTGYALERYHATGSLPPIVRLDQLIDKGDRTERHTLDATRTRKDCVAFMHRASALLTAAKSGIFLPCNPAEWCCSSKWCGYARTCPYYVEELETD